MNRSSAIIGFAAIAAASLIIRPGVAARAQPVAEQASAASVASSSITAADADRQGDNAVQAKDYGEAIRLYRLAADQGDVPAEVQLGYYYHHGIGVNVDYAEAMHWYRQAADQGDALAENQIGYLYEHGLGVGQDYAQALYWFRLAANQGWPVALHNVAYVESRCPGADQSLAAARAWMTQGTVEAGTPTITWPGRAFALRGPLRP
jgi:TPR repeat protein